MRGMDMEMGNKIKNLFKEKKAGGPPEEQVDAAMLTEIIHDGRVRNLRSHEIAKTILKYLKKG